MADGKEDFNSIRQIYSVLTLHFLDGMKQSDISAALNLSASKVSRLISQGRRLGMVKVELESPFQHLIDLERKLMRATGVSGAIVTPAVSGSPEETLRQIGRAAANLLLETLKDGDVIAVTGGRAVQAVVENIQPERGFDVVVVPLTGGVQGKCHTDVNHIVTVLAERLGGSKMVLHAPLFVENRKQREMLMEMASVREVFDMARRATVALVGVGSILAPGSSYYDLNPVPIADREQLVRGGVVAEFLAHLIGESGAVVDNPLNANLVALSPGELAQCPRVIGMASGQEKTLPIRSVANGHYLDTLIVDELTASEVLETTSYKQQVV